MKITTVAKKEMREWKREVDGVCFIIGDILSLFLGKEEEWRKIKQEEGRKLK